MMGARGALVVVLVGRAAAERARPRKTLPTILGFILLVARGLSKETKECVIQC